MKPVRFTTTPTRPADVYGNQMKVEAFDADGKPAGSTYANNEEEAAEWFESHKAACEAADPGATAKTKKGAKKPDESDE